MTGAHKILYWCSRGSIHTFPLSWNVICYQTSCTTYMFFFFVSEENSWWSWNLRRTDIFCHLENVVLIYIPKKWSQHSVCKYCSCKWIWIKIEFKLIHLSPSSHCGFFYSLILYFFFIVWKDAWVFKMAVHRHSDG